MKCFPEMSLSIKKPRAVFSCNISHLLYLTSFVHRKLTYIAFNDMNPLPMKLLQNRRSVHMERLHAEIKELENLQKAYKAEHVQCKDTELDTLASEGEEEA